MEDIIKQEIQERLEDIENNLDSYDIDEDGYFTIEPLFSFAKEDYINVRTTFSNEVCGWVVTECRKQIGDRMLQRFNPEDDLGELQFEVVSPPNHSYLRSVWVFIRPKSEDEVYILLEGVEGGQWISPEEAVNKIVNL